MSSLARVGWIGRGVVLELVRRKDLYVLILLMMVFCIGAIGARVAGVDDAATGTFLLNLGMTLAYAFAHVLTLLLGARQVPDELEKRTIYPLLARPVSRGEYLIGKWAAGFLCGVACYLLFLLLVWLSAPRLETYDAMLFLQTVVLVAVSLALTAALALLLSLWLPKAMAIVVLGAYFVGAAVAFSVVTSIAQGSAVESAVDWVMLYLPDFSKLNLTTRYTDGISALSAAQFLGLVGYGALYTWLSLFVGERLFTRRSL